MRRASIAILVLGCGTSTGGPESTPQGESSFRAPPPATSLALGPAPIETPTVGEPATVSLPVAGFADAVLAVPVGARDRRPLVIATHGNFDRPEWQCEVWSAIVRQRAFVLCPRGVLRPDSPAPDDPRFTYEHNTKLEREVDAAVAALRSSRYGPFVGDGPAVWAGFARGAIMGVAVAARRPHDFTTLLLVEGGVDRFGDDAVRSFAAGGGRDVLFVCAQRGCKGVATRRARALERAGVNAAVVDAGNIGHAYSGPVADTIAAALPAFLASDPRFRVVFETRPSSE